MGDINEAIASIQKSFGKEAIMRVGDKPRTDIPVIPTRLFSLDLALGVGGLPRGRICEIYGPEASGKSTLALQLIASAQSTGGTAAYIDMEHSLDPKYCDTLGVDVDNLLVSQPDYGEQALEITNTLINSGKVDVVIVDSVAALVPKAELDGEMGDSFMGLHARLMSQAMRKLTGTVSKTGTCLIFINQIRATMAQGYGNPDTTTGGKALRFYASVRLEVRRIGAIKDGEEVVGARTRIKVAKNKVGAPFKETEVDLYYGLGFSRETDILDLALDRELVTKQGAWYSYNDERLGQGREKVKEHFKSNPDVMENIEEEVRKMAAA